ncbi:hypothetical protein HaLaN_04891 [Haematococcus lacustris]|uniref:Uncharacterized protein n=1 Tax=Haematococcus lacustris TaxID=44745 RepID=A0A699YJN0_HAELA|nr:hypothetical protein HaLaN_04891 [Haematococcus lacustris]
MSGSRRAMPSNPTTSTSSRPNQKLGRWQGSHQGVRSSGWPWRGCGMRPQVGGVGCDLAAAGMTAQC